MNFDEDINVPEDLMLNVENRLKKHVARKRTRIMAYKIIPMVLIASLVVINFETVTGFASKLFRNNLNDGVSLAIDNKKSDKLNKTISVDGITVTFKDVVADDTGIALSYEISNADYDLSGAEVLDKSGNIILNQEDGSFHLSEGGIYYIENLQSGPGNMGEKVIVFPSTQENNITIRFTKLINVKDSGYIKDISIELPINISKHEVKNIEINKTITTEIGSVILKEVKCGAMFSELSYRFIPKEGIDISFIALDIQLKSGTRELDIYENYGSDNRDAAQKIEDSKNGPIWYDNAEKYTGYVKFTPVIYDGDKTLELNIISIKYRIKVNKEYLLKKSNVHETYDFMGNKFTLKSMITEDDKRDQEGFKDAPKEQQEYFSKHTLVELEFETTDRAFVSFSDYSFIDKSKSALLGKDAICGAGYEYEEAPILRQNEDEFQAVIKRILRLSPDLESYIHEKYNKGLVRFIADVQGPHNELILKIENMSNYQLVGNKIEVKIK